MADATEREREARERPVSRSDGRDRSLTEMDHRIQVVPEAGCWIWVAALNDSGYGQASVKGKEVKAHRLVWERHKGPLPSGLVLDHICRVRSCVNPSHLRLVTQRENSTENSNSVASVNSKKTHCRKCGGRLTLTPRSDRRERQCVPCREAYMRHYNTTRQRGAAAVEARVLADVIAAVEGMDWQNTSWGQRLVCRTDLLTRLRAMEGHTDE